MQFCKNNNFKRIIVSVFLIFSLFSLFGFNKVNAQVNGNDYAVVTDVTSSGDEEAGLQRIKLEIKSGKYTNSFFDTTFKQPTLNIKRDLQKGDVVLVHFTTGDLDDKVQSVEVVDLYRLPNIFWAPLLFILILLVTVIVKYRRKVYIFLSIVFTLGISALVAVFLKVNPLFLLIPLFSLSFFVVLFAIYKKPLIAVVGLLIPAILGVGAILLSYIALQITGIQLSYLSVIASFYNINSSDYYESFYTAAVVSSLVGSIYIAYQQILESIKIKISDIEVSKKELTLKSFKHMVRSLDTIIFPSLGFLVGILFSVLFFLQRSIGIEAALNNDYWVALSVLTSISLIVWVITVPVCALLCGVILGRLEQHKIVTDKTIQILD